MIDIVKFLGKALVAYAFDVLQRDTPVAADERFLLIGDIGSAVHSINGYLGEARPRFRTLIGLLGALEVAGGWLLSAEQVAGVARVEVDGISPWAHSLVRTYNNCP